MAYNFFANFFASVQQLPDGAFDPQTDPVTLSINLVRLGIYIGSSMLRPLPRAVAASGIHIQNAFVVALALMLLFGLGMIWIGWLVADNATRYSALGRTMTRASHVLLVFTIAFSETNTTNK